MADQSQTYSGSGISSRLGHWIGKPFAEDMDLISWALFTAFIVTIAVLWYLTLRKLIEEI